MPRYVKDLISQTRKKLKESIEESDKKISEKIEDLLGCNIDDFFEKMEEFTIQLLNSFDKSIKLLNISNKNIIGKLDLSGFNKLEILNCSHNKITKIHNIPVRLKYFVQFY